MNKIASRLVFFLSLICTPAFSQDAHDNEVATLYRNSLMDSMMRIHVATFDTKDGFRYNWENCILAAHLFQSQTNVKTHFWCESGKYQE